MPHTKTRKKVLCFTYTPAVACGSGTVNEICCGDVNIVVWYKYKRNGD